MMKLTPFNMVGYELEELSKETQDAIIDKEVDNIIKTEPIEQINNLNEVIREYKRLQGERPDILPWLFRRYSEDYVIDRIKDKGKLFNINGDAFPIEYFGGQAYFKINLKKI